MVIASPETDLIAKIDLGLQNFVGDYGLKKTTLVQNGFAFGWREPLTPSPLTTWSLFHDEKTLVFVEGSFYDAYCGHRPQPGYDPVLGRQLCNEYRRGAENALAGLSGSYSGCIIDYISRRLMTFVDRLATKPLFWAREGKNLVISSNLASFRNLRAIEIDSLGAFQYLTFGFPLGTRTLLKDISIHRPSSMQVFDDHGHRTVPYWKIPDRRETRPVVESAERIADAIEQSVTRIHRAANGTLGLGLTGGHDSRVILSALVTQAVPFKPIRWDERNANDKTARNLCTLIGKDLKLVPGINNGDDLESLRDDVFLYTQGMYRYQSGFSRLGRACLQHDVKCLMVGFAGDVISGGLTIPSPHYMRDIRELSRRALINQMEGLSFESASSILPHMSATEIKEAQAEWYQSFIDESGRGHLVDVAIWQRLANRNVKRICFSMLPLSKYVQTVFPFLDNTVLDAYFSLPIRALNNQQAHCYASFCHTPRFAAYPVSGSPVPLKVEARFPSAVHRAKLWQHAIRHALARYRSAKEAINWQGEYQRMYDEIMRCPLFSSAVLKAWRSEERITPANLRHLHTLSKAYALF
jgi:asparagine synthetase B (glutamine-hydrolysing)